MYHAEVIDISREHALFAYADAYTRYANNMYNTANYYIRNLMTGLQKDIPTPNEASVIGIVRDAVPGINASLRKKYGIKVANIRADGSLTDAGRTEKLRKLKCSVFRMPTPDAWFAGYGLLDAVFRHTGNHDYKAGHAHVMQNAVKDCCEAWTSYFRSRAQSGRSGLPGPATGDRAGTGPPCSAIPPAGSGAVGSCSPH